MFFLSVFMLIRVGIIHLHNFGITQPVYSSELISFAVHGNWTDWGDWNPCSVTCAGGTQSRSRTCTNPPPRNGGRECSGESEDVQSCNEMPCPSKYFFFSRCKKGVNKRFRALEVAFDTLSLLSNYLHTNLLTYY